MREDYQPYFRELKSRLVDLGYMSVREHDLGVSLDGGWKLSFEGERYYGPLFGIYVIPPTPSNGRQRGYEVGLLMRAFEKIFGQSFGEPTIGGQVDFLIKEKNLVFGDPAFYEAEYAKLHDFAA
jgi:hypothetical protein